MPINYLQSFQGGELSRKMDGRSDLEVYKTGCRDLQNFYVLPQGGVERRPGTEFLILTGSDGSNPARLIPFIFTSDIQYVVEVGLTSIKIHESDGSQVYTPTVGSGVTVNYTATELNEIQFSRRADTLLLTHRNHPPLKVERKTLTPTFELNLITYVYPPLQDLNLTATTVDPQFNPTSGASGTILASNDAIFRKGHEGSQWGVDYIRNATQRTFTETLSASNLATESMNVSFSDWFVSTDGNWDGQCILERSVNGGSFTDYQVIGTSGTTESNFSLNSSVAEDGDTLIRARFILVDGSIYPTITITAQSLYLKGLVTIGTVAGADKVISSATGTASTNKVTITTSEAHGLTTNDYVEINNLGFTNEDPNGTHQITVTSTTEFTYTLTIASNRTYTTTSSPKIDATSRTTVTVNSALGAVDSGGGDYTATPYWSEAAFSDFRKYPISSEFYQNRLFFTGSKDEPATIFGSVFDDIYNFLQGTTSDMSIKRITDSFDEAKYLIGKNELFMGTSSGTIKINSVDSDALITQTNINTEIQNSYGSSTVQPVIANDVIVYLQNNKLKLRELIYAREQNVFVGNDLNILSEDITKGSDNQGVQELFLQQNPDQNIWCIKNDGSACLLSYDRQQKILGWSNIITTGSFVSGAVLSQSGEDLVWIVVKRTTSTGTEKYCIEKFKERKDLNWYVDSGKQEDHSAKQYTTVELNLFTGGGVQKFKIGKDNVSGLVENDLIKISGLTDIPILNNKVFKLVNLNSNDWILKTIDGTAEIRPPAGISDQNYSVSVKKVVNTISGLSHLEGLTVQVVGDGSFIKTETVSSGAITTTEYYNTLLVGLQFTSILRPMRLEPQLATQVSQSRVKAVAKIVVRFLNTKGASVGEAERQLTNFPVVKTTDKVGQVVALTTNSIRFFVGSDYEREKLIEVKQDLPYPMTVISIASNINVEGA